MCVFFSCFLFLLFSFLRLCYPFFFFFLILFIFSHFFVLVIFCFRHFLFSSFFVFVILRFRFFFFVICFSMFFMLTHFLCDFSSYEHHDSVNDNQGLLGFRVFIRFRSFRICKKGSFPSIPSWVTSSQHGPPRRQPEEAQRALFKEFCHGDRDKARDAAEVAPHQAHIAFQEMGGVLRALNVCWVGLTSGTRHGPLHPSTTPNAHTEATEEAWARCLLVALSRIAQLVAFLQ